MAATKSPPVKLSDVDSFDIGLEKISLDELDLRDTVGTEHEVLFAELEARIRQVTLDLLQPIVRRSQVLERDFKHFKAETERHAALLIDIPKISLNCKDQEKTLDGFRQEMSKWDASRMDQEAKVGNSLSFMRLELDAVRNTVSKSTSTVVSLQRTTEGSIEELGRALESFDTFRQDINRRLGKQGVMLSDFSDDFSTRLTELQAKQHKLGDELQDQSTGLLKVASEIRKTDKNVTMLFNDVHGMENSKASLEEVHAIRDQMSHMIKETSLSVLSLNRTLTGMMKDVRENFRVAMDTVATQSTSALSEVRVSCQVALERCDKLVTDVQSFIEKTTSRSDESDRKLEQSGAKLLEHITKLKTDFEAYRGSQRHELNSAALERRTIRQNMEGVLATVDDVTKSVENMSGVVWMVVQSERAAAALNVQDDVDRAKVALIGYQDAKPSTLASAASTRPSTRGTAAAPSPLPSVRGSFARSSPYTSRGGLDLGGVGADDDGPGAVISVDQRCLNCSGQAKSILVGFKMACLQYAPGAVSFASKKWQRSELLDLRVKLLEQAAQALQKEQSSGGMRRDPFSTSKATAAENSFVTMPLEVARDRVMRAATEKSANTAVLPELTPRVVLST